MINLTVYTAVTCTYGSRKPTGILIDSGVVMAIDSGKDGRHSAVTFCAGSKLLLLLLLLLL